MLVCIPQTQTSCNLKLGMLQSLEILYQDSELNILQIILDMHSIYQLLLKMVNPCPIPDFLKVPASVHSVESRHTALTNLVPYPDIRRDVYRAHHRIPNAVDAVGRYGRSLVSMGLGG